MQEGTDYTITDHVNELHAKLCPNKRTLELFTSLISHIHAFARETRPTHAEWTTAIEYLTRAGKESTEFKNEFVLLSDCMGISALIDELNHPKPPVSGLLIRQDFTLIHLCRDAQIAANQVLSLQTTLQRFRLVLQWRRKVPLVNLCTSVRR